MRFDRRLRSARRLVAAAALLIAGTGLAVAEGDRGGVTGLLSDPGGAGLAGVEVVLTGVDVRASYTARTDGEGRYDFPAVAPGAYRVDVRRPGIVPVAETLAVAAGERLNADIGTMLTVQIGMALRAASADAVRRWVSGGQPPAGPLEWECTSNGAPCTASARESRTTTDDAVPAAAVALPSLVRQPPGDLVLDALVALDGRPGIVQMRGTIGTDGFLSGASISSATSPELAAVALMAARQMRWEPARLRGVPVNTSMTLEIRF